MAETSPNATALGQRLLAMWANQECTLAQLKRGRDRVPPWITPAEYDAAIVANPPVNPDDPNSYSTPSTV